MGNSHQSLLTQMTGVPRAFQKLQRTKKKGEHCLGTHCLSHLKAQLGKNVVLDFLGCKLKFFFPSLCIPPFRLTNFLCSANNREANSFLSLGHHRAQSGQTFSLGSYRRDPDGAEQVCNLNLQNPPITPPQNSPEPSRLHHKREHRV